MPPPDLYYQNRPEPAPPPGGGMVANLLKALLVFAILGGAGWAFYHYYWVRRPDQEHSLKDAQGNVLHAKIEGRTDGILKYTSLDDNMTHLVPISELAADDQAYVRQLPAQLNLDYPIDCFLTGPGAQPVSVGILLRTSDWLKYTLKSDLSTHYAAISALPAADQQLVRQLPFPAFKQYPVDFLWPDSSGQPQDVHIAGHSDDFVEIIAPSDENPRYEPMSGLTEADRSFVAQLPATMTIRYPFTVTLTDHESHKIRGVVSGQGTNMVKITLPGEELARFYPLSNFTLADQKLLQLVPISVAAQYPLEILLSDQSGHTIPARVIKRTNALVQFVSLSDNNTHLFPMSMLSATDQMVLKIFPAATAGFHLPLESALTNDKGDTMSVRIEGRSADAVTFTMLTDNSKHIYPLTRLSPADQAVLKLFPVSAAMADDPAKAKAMRDRIETLTRENVGLQGKISDPQPSFRDQLPDIQAQFDKNQKEIDDLTNQLKTIDDLNNQLKSLSGSGAAR